MMMRVGLAILVVALAAGCAPRTRIGDRLINQSSLTNARSSFTGPQPAPVSGTTTSNP
jgi:hypothetical protein